MVRRDRALLLAADVAAPTPPSRCLLPLLWCAPMVDETLAAVLQVATAQRRPRRCPAPAWRRSPATAAADARSLSLHQLRGRRGKLPSCLCLALPLSILMQLISRTSLPTPPPPSSLSLGGGRPRPWSCVNRLRWWRPWLHREPPRRRDRAARPTLPVRALFLAGGGSARKP